MPFIIGVLIAYILYLPCKKFERIYSKIKIVKKRARPLSIITVYTIVTIIIILAIRFVVPVILQSFNDLISNFQNYFNITMQSINELPDDSIFKSEFFSKIVNEVRNYDFTRLINIDTITQYAQSAISFATGIFDFFVSIIVSIYILLERREIIGLQRSFQEQYLRKMFIKI